MTHRSAAAVATGALAAAILFALGGMLLLQYAPAAASRATPMLPLLMKAPTFLYMVSLPVAVLLTFWPALGMRRSLLAAASAATIGALAELLGTTTGIPFGRYSYTDFLGPKLLAHVPFTIPPTWYAASLLSYVFASRVTQHRAIRGGLTALFMVCWDVALDPAMSAAVPIWHWGLSGAYYGMPAVNWLGWFVTSLVIATAYELIDASRAASAIAGARRLWLLNGAFAIGIVLLRQMWLAVVVGSIALLLPVALSRRHAAAQT